MDESHGISEKIVVSLPRSIRFSFEQITSRNLIFHRLTASSPEEITDKPAQLYIKCFFFSLAGEMINMKTHKLKSPRVGGNKNDLRSSECNITNYRSCTIRSILYCNLQEKYNLLRQLHTSRQLIMSTQPILVASRWYHFISHRRGRDTESGA